MYTAQNFMLNNVHMNNDYSFSKLHPLKAAIALLMDVKPTLVSKSYPLLCRYLQVAT